MNWSLWTFCGPLTQKGPVKDSILDSWQSKSLCAIASSLASKVLSIEKISFTIFLLIFTLGSSILSQH